MNKKVTIVTGLWDLGRENIDGWAKRSFQHYKDRFSELLRCDVNLAIWIPREMEEEVWKIRDNIYHSMALMLPSLLIFTTYTYLTSFKPLYTIFPYLFLPIAVCMPLLLHAHC